ncbi:MAG TPA: hypothetical protein ENK02_07785 [Planctomycetes bacterium]|nr:hypothetical protein [Planctomycetota bacterium]
MPYTSPVTNVTVKYVIIHLMPGLYARSTAFGANFAPNPDNGLIPNGEVFPIQLPKGVSIQGTSALNTVFCLGTGALSSRGQGPAFLFGKGNATGEGTFIDSISIYGAQGTLDKKEQAAIYVDKEVASSPTITNCFLYGNICGIGIESDQTASTPILHDGIKIFNNTIAFNQLGIWNGDANSNNREGASKLILVNNVFDINVPSTLINRVLHYVTKPLGGTATVSAMEGIHPNDLLVNLGTGTGNFNAYPKNGSPNNRFDLRVPIALFPATKPRSSGVTPQPSLDIEPYAGTGPSSRGVLFVSDLVQRTGATYMNNSTFDGSPHDFRLAPGVAKPTDSATTKINPLVNAGWAVDPNNFTLTMANGLTMAHPPGYLPLNASSQNSWAFHSWVFDAEGFGNNRIYAYSGPNASSPIYPAAPQGRLPIDVGADELGELLIAGYRFGTTTFIHISQSSSPFVKGADNKRAWFFVPRTGMTSASGTVPTLTGITKPYVRLYGHLASQASPPISTNYLYPMGSGSIKTYPWFSSWTFLQPNSYYDPTAVDTVPHLLDDLHPWWDPQTIQWTFNNGVTQTIHSQYSNPIWQECISSYNLVHYLDPAINRIHHSGTYKGSSTQFSQWLDYTWTKDIVGGSSVFYANFWAGTTGAPNFGRLNPTFQTSTDTQWGVLLSPAASGGNSQFDLFPATFKSPGNIDPNAVVHYSLEKRDNGFFATSVADTNLQSFDVLVWEASN